MLTELHIRQFALVDEIRIELQSGMTVFTGETGAGKSILVDALGAAFGARASADWVRHGAKRAEISVCLEMQDARIDELLELQGIEAEAVLLLRRIINADGRSRAWLNGVAVPLKVLQQIGEISLDLHGQHEHQALMQKSYQRQILDQRLDATLLTAASSAWQQHRHSSQALQQWQQQQQQGLMQESWLRQQLEELEQIQLEIGLLEQLESEVAASKHIARIQQAAAHALACIDENDQSARSLLAEAGQAIDGVAEFHSGLQASADILRQIDLLLNELPPYLREAEFLELDADNIANQELRLNSMQRLLQRHQCDEPGLLALQQQWRDQLGQLDTASWDQEQLQAALKAAEQQYTAAAKTLHLARKAATNELAVMLQPWLDKLALQDMKVRIDVVANEALDGWHQDGWDNVTFMLSSNQGEPFKPLHHVASGGELSRLVLSLKACGACAASPAVAVFDEVDVGIGGETAWSVGALLAAMGIERQVLVVSHLAQVAAVADHHIRITKSNDNERTYSTLESLQGRDLEQELARMLGDVSPQGLKQAKAMRKRGRMLLRNVHEIT